MTRHLVLATALAAVIATSVSAIDWIVSRVPTGETFVTNESVVRIKGINAPPAEESRQHLEELIGGSAVSVTGVEDYDLQGRWWVYINGPDGRDVGAHMIADGYALADRRESHDKRDEYIDLEQGAKRAGQGLWANPQGWTLVDSILRQDPTSSQPSLGEEGNAFPITTDPSFPVYPGDFLYHKAGCWLMPDEPPGMSQVKPHLDSLFLLPVAYAIIEGYHTCSNCGVPALDTLAVDMAELRQLWNSEYVWP